MNIEYELTQGPPEAQLYIDKCMLIRNNIVWCDRECFRFFSIVFFFFLEGFHGCVCGLVLTNAKNTNIYWGG